LRAAAIVQTIFAGAQLAALRRVDTPELDAHSMSFKSVAINDAGLTNKIIGERGARNAGAAVDIANYGGDLDHSLGMTVQLAATRQAQTFHLAKMSDQ
jgi:hypothetical protein